MIDEVGQQARHFKVVDAQRRADADLKIEGTLGRGRHVQVVWLYTAFNIDKIGGPRVNVCGWECPTLEAK